MILSAVILAAGQGTRMKSALPKVLHPIAGKPMVEYVVDCVKSIGVDKPVLVVGYEGERVRQKLGDTVEYVDQIEPLGTGDAVKRARSALEGRAQHIVVLYADMPMLKPETLQALVRKHEASQACVTMLTVEADESMGFGRIVRDEKGKLLKIVEEAEASPTELAIRELNCGVYLFEANWLWEHVAKLQPSPNKQEYLLTDLIEMAVREAVPIESERVTDIDEAVGVNTRVHLARVERIMRGRILERLMLAGVTVIDPDTTYIDATVEIGQDTSILPGTHIRGRTLIGTDCRIGPMAQIEECEIGNEVAIGPSTLEHSTVRDQVRVGPYCHLRKGTFLSERVHLGDHAELKNARLGPETKMGHFSYLGDARVGARVNIGAGTITCNYDGKNKHETIIEDDAFIGSDTMLVAPVNVGARSKTGAGSVVTRDIPPDSLAYGVPAKIARKLS